MNLSARRCVQRCILWLLIGAIPTVTAGAVEVPSRWREEWPRTDFSKLRVPVSEVQTGGPPRDGIPSIDRPEFRPIDLVTGMADREPVIALSINGDARAYPLRVMIWHEIVNDIVGGVPVAVTYCPLCNAAIVFDRRVEGRTLSFGTTGKLRYSDLVMYDRETESWWQQFTGNAIAGELADRELVMLPSRLEAWEKFKASAPTGFVLVPNDPTLRPYGANPYVGYEGGKVPFLYKGPFPRGIRPMQRVIVVGDKAWSLALLQEKGRIDDGQLRLEWIPGQASALDRDKIAAGRDVGNVVVKRREGDDMAEIPHAVTFAFVYFAFNRDTSIFSTLE
ncbi:MAG: DUF3179 domain-containing protein [Rhodospirillaceae bacterium]|nr:DUF3179 domain-containing protein [Rhodospirillaceae bacterium]